MSNAAMTLCQRCGFCCDGTLFDVVPLRQELAPSVTSRLRVLGRPDGSQVFEQPCSALSGGSCAVYSERPAPCRAYRCNLLIALEESEVSLDEATGIVVQARALARRVEAALPGDAMAGTESLRKRARGTTLSTEAQDALVRWESMLTNQFRGRRG